VKVIVFDFDGTIADSFAAVLRITNQLAAEFGYAPARLEDVPRLKNLSSREIVKQSKVSSCDILPTLTLWNAGFPTSQLGIPAPRHLSRS
jgi:phosphoglycolate phosphatase-like HAD superfamily hydrolase